MAGELDDPLLLSSVPGGTTLIPGTERSRSGFGHGNKDDESSLGMNMTGAMGNDDSAMSIGKLGHASGMGVDDSELSNSGVGVSSRKEKSAISSSKNKKKPKDKKNKKRKSRKSGHSDGDELGGSNYEASTLKINT